jgi:hypothetical protein
MYSGEYEASKVTSGSDNFMSVFFLGFIFSIIILSNYVNALAISDIQDISQKADYLDLNLRIFRIEKHERTLSSKNWCTKIAKSLRIIPETFDIKMARVVTTNDGYMIIFENGIETGKKTSKNYKIELFEKLKQVIEMNGNNEQKQHEEKQIHDALYEMQKIKKEYDKMKGNVKKNKQQ